MKKNLTRNTIPFIIILLSGLIIINSCDDPNQQAINFNFPETGPVNYAEHVGPFLRLRCAYTGCHDGISQAGSYDLSTHLNVIKYANITGVVNPETGEVEGSLLLQVLDGTNPHLQNLLLINATENQIQGVKRWLKSNYP